jgi:hypothetical protein
VSARKTSAERAREVGRKIRAGLRRHGLQLGTFATHNASYSPDTSDDPGRVCAIGGALAYGAKTTEELNRLSNGYVAAEAARIMGRSTRVVDMQALERGFEGWNDLWAGKNVFYRLGQKLRGEVKP